MSMLTRFLHRLGHRQRSLEVETISFRQVKLPEEYEEERIMSLEMHYGDEPLYLLDPPEWPYPEEL